VSVLCLVELDAAGPTDGSLRALTFARELAGPVTGGPALIAVLFAAANRADAAQLGRYGVTEAYVIEPEALDGYAPQAWARTLQGLASLVLAGAVVAAGTDRGHEVLAHLGALTGQPMAANCLSARPAADGTIAVARQRWAGLLIEDAVLSGSPALLSVATDALPPAEVDAPAGVDPPAVHVHEPDLAPADLAVRAEISAGAGSAGRTVSPRWRSWPACSAGWSGCPGWSPARAGGRTPSRSARPVPRSPRSCTWPAGSAGRSSTWRAARAPSTSSR